MGQSSPLAIATAAVIRLVKEEESYHHELETQKHRIKKFEDEPVRPEEDIENKTFLLKQERQALEETKKVLPSLKQKIQEAVAKLDTLLLEEGKKGMNSNVAEIDAAKEAMSRAKTATREIS